MSNNKEKETPIPPPPPPPPPPSIPTPSESTATATAAVVVDEVKKEVNNNNIWSEIISKIYSSDDHQISSDTFKQLLNQLNSM